MLNIVIGPELSLRLGDFVASLCVQPGPVSVCMCVCLLVFAVSCVLLPLPLARVQEGSRGGGEG